MDSPIPRLEDVVYKATYFSRHDFWAWVEGASFSIGPYTGLGEGGACGAEGNGGV